MIEYTPRINIDFRKRLSEKLARTGINRSLLDETTEYVYKNLEIMERIIEGFKTWAAFREVDCVLFMKGFLVLADIFRKNTERHDGIISSYLSNFAASEKLNFSDECSQPWHYEGHSGLYEGVKGIFKCLTDSGLSQDFIDNYYLDGSLLEIHETCLDTVVSMDCLLCTENPGPADLSEGLFLMEDRFRKMYNKLFIEPIEDTHGTYGAVKAALNILQKKG